MNEKEDIRDVTSYKTALHLFIINCMQRIIFHIFHIITAPLSPIWVKVSFSMELLNFHIQNML